MVNSKNYFPALTGLRAVAAYLIFIHHSFNAASNSAFGNRMVFASQAGVTIFFVLSGFLIAYKYNPTAGTINYRSYLVKRFARIYPLYLLLTIIILLWQKDFEPLHWFLNLTLLKGLFDAYKFSGIGPGWSLTVELFFYILAPVLFSMFRRNGLVTLIIFLLYGSTLVVFSKAYYNTSFLNSLGFMLDYTFFGHCFEFYCGYVVAKYYQESDFVFQKSYFTLGGLLLTVAGIGLIAWTSDKIWFLENQEVVMWSTSINNFGLPVAVSLLLYGLITENTMLSRLLNTNFLQLLGKSSYAFFLIHSGLIYEFFYFHLSTHKFIIFLALNALAIILYYSVEKPFYSLITRQTFNTKPSAQHFFKF